MIIFHYRKTKRCTIQKGCSTLFSRVNDPVATINDISIMLPHTANTYKVERNTNTKAYYVVTYLEGNNQQLLLAISLSISQAGRQRVSYISCVCAVCPFSHFKQLRACKELVKCMGNMTQRHPTRVSAPHILVLL